MNRVKATTTAVGCRAAMSGPGPRDQLELPLALAAPHWGCLLYTSDAADEERLV